jgi:hypothetical protein
MQLILASILGMISLGICALPQPQWKTYSSTEGRFAVSVPDEPRVTTLATETANGQLLTHIVSATDKDLNEYLVSWTAYNRDMESKGTAQTLDRMRDALIQAKGGKLSNESTVSVMNHTGRAVTFVDSDGRTVNVRFYFIGNRAFQVMAESRGSANLPEAEKFFKSFSVQD